MTQTQDPSDTVGLALAEREVMRAPRRMPGWGWVLVIYAASRVLTTGILGLFYWIAPALGWSVGNYATRPGFITFMDAWDGKFYRTVALHGYPSALPVDLHGHVEPNAWAFLPVYPWITRGLMSVTGLNFTVAGVILSVIFGGGAAYLLYRLLVPRVGTRSAMWAVAFFCIGPMSFVLQVTYAESLYLVLIFAALIAMTSRRYLLMIPFGVTAAFTHPGALALCAALAIMFIVGLIKRERVPWTERVATVVAGVAIAIAGFAWPVIAGVATGFKAAYFDTELSWWTDYVGPTHFVPFTPWFVMAHVFLGSPGVLLVIVVLAGFIWIMTHRNTRILGLGILSFVGSYGAYLVAVFLPQQSLVRLLLPMAPLLGAPVLTKSVVFRRIAVGVLIASQFLVIATLWVLGPP